MIQLIVNGQTYLYPENRDSPPWGEEATAWAQAVTNTLLSIAGSGDILETTANIANNQVAPANVVGLNFDPSLIRGGVVTYSVYRVTTSTGAMEAVETGTMYLGYLSNAASWDLAVVGGQGAGITFSVTSGGQVQYTTTNFTGSNYSGTMKFVAKALTQ